MQTIHQLRKSIPQIGRVEWIGIAAKREAAMESQQAVVVQPGTGIDGEHHATSRRFGKASKRQVTLIQAEHLPLLAAILQRDVTPEMLRRNIVVSGVNLAALKKLPFVIGEARLHGSGPCPPCSRMETNLGPGGYASMIGHGGITAIVEEQGRIQVGDSVQFADA